MILKSTSDGICRQSQNKGQYMLAELVWYKPCNLLAFNLRLIVYPFNREEAFSQTLGANDIMLKFGTESFTVPNNLRVDIVNCG
jgi:hypothetical protein